MKNDFYNQRKCPFSSLFIPSSFCTRSQSNSNGSVKKEEMATNENAKARAQKSKLEVKMFLLRKFKVFQFFSFTFRMSLHSGFRSFTGGRRVLPPVQVVRTFSPSYSATEIKPEWVFYFHRSFLSFYFSFFSCLFLLFLLQFSLSSTSFFSFFFAFKNSFGKLACQVATQVSYFRNALSFFATENFNPILNVAIYFFIKCALQIKTLLSKKTIKKLPDSQNQKYLGL